MDPIESVEIPWAIAEQMPQAWRVLLVYSVDPTAPPRAVCHRVGCLDEDGNPDIARLASSRAYLRRLGLLRKSTGKDAYGLPATAWEPVTG